MSDKKARGTARRAPLVFNPKTGCFLPSLADYSIKIVDDDVVLFNKQNYAYRVSRRKMTCTCPQFIFGHYLPSRDGVCMHIECAQALA